MEYRILGSSGFSVPVLSFGTGTFGGDHVFFGKWGNTDVEQAKRLIGICLDAGVNLFDTADVYSRGQSEEILGKAIEGQRDKLLISTKTTFPMGDNPNDIGSSRHHIIRSCEASLRRLNTDYIDIYTMHGFDALTAVEETLRALDTLVQSGKVRYIACSNFSGWHLMKSLAISEKYGWARYMAHQAHYSLLRREYEWELMPLALDQNVSTLVWGPLSQGRLSGKFRREQPMPEGTRVAQGAAEGPAIPDDWFYGVIDVLDAISAETGKSVAQVSLNWLLQRPTVASVIIGARTEKQLLDNLGAAGWALSAEQVARLDAVTETDTIYPYWHQRNFAKRNPLPTKLYNK
ncbi:MAG TPA: aldo/keto reductase [Aggregatilinea sp.]|uniref:aldo/keto reductase n=1 Tax=Aggregatilinea sp. TaxID=2806333 RepID=UPI002BDDCD94|nr:aldo/keto reductase [Aggregatilinea sp.]HML20887.1 aldo/keto reductase [Aggregatilinea sp.]